MKVWNWQSLKRIIQHFVDEGEVGFFPLAVSIDQFGSRNERHTHIFYETAYVVQGEVDHVFYPSDSPPITRHLVKGDAFTVLPGMSHKLYNGKKCMVYNIIFTPELPWFDFESISALPGFRHMLGQLPDILHVSPSEQRDFPKLIQGLAQELFTAGSAYQQKSAALLTSLLVDIGRSPRKGSPEAQEFARQIVAAIEFMTAHFSSTLSLDDIVNEAKIEKTYFCHLFKQETGLTPWQYLCKLRMEQARFLLLTSMNLSIAEIAFACGFNDNGYFSKIFRRLEGVTPNEFRGKQKTKY